MMTRKLTVPGVEASNLPLHLREIIILLAKSHDSAGDALREFKRLHREGWIELTCYALVE